MDKKGKTMKTAIVSGASTGIGKATAIAFGKAGYRVFLVARSTKKLEEVKQEIGEHAVIFSADLSSFDGIHKLIGEIKEQTDEIHVLANIAGIWHGDKDVYAGKDFETFDEQVITDTFMVGTIAPTLLAHACIPLMKPGSSIINLSGTFENGAKGWLPYFVSKRAIEDLTTGLSQELEEKGIRVNGISPSDTATESYARFFPQYMEDAISPEAIAKQFIELADPTSTVTGKIFVMKKGNPPRADFHY